MKISLEIDRVATGVLILFLLTGVLASFPPLHLINNALFILLIIISLFFSSRSTLEVEKFLIIICVLSFCNHIIYVDKYDLHYESLIPLWLLLGVNAVKKVYQPYTFESLLVINGIPLFLLLLLGGVSTSMGRLDTEYLNPNTRGLLYIFCLNSALFLIFRAKRLLIPSIIIVISSAVYLALSGSRKDLILLAFSLIVYIPLFLHYFINLKGVFSKVIIASVTLFAVIFTLDRAYQNLQERFLNHNNQKEIIVVDDYSALERKSFINTSMKVLQEYPLGIGYGNIKQAMQEYGDTHFKVTSNAHSFFAEIIYSSGILGILFLIIFLINYYKLIRPFKDKWYVIIYIVIGVFTISFMLDKLFWIVLACLEVDLRNRQINLR